MNTPNPKVEHDLGSIVTIEVHATDDGQWQVRLCRDGTEFRRFDPVDTLEEVDSMVNYLVEMAISEGATEISSFMN